MLLAFLILCIIDDTTFLEGVVCCSRFDSTTRGQTDKAQLVCLKIQNSKIVKCSVVKTEFIEALFVLLSVFARLWLELFKYEDILLCKRRFFFSPYNSKGENTKALAEPVNV